MPRLEAILILLLTLPHPRAPSSTDKVDKSTMLGVNRNQDISQSTCKFTNRSTSMPGALIRPRKVTTAGYANVSVKHISWFTDSCSTQYGWGEEQKIDAGRCSLSKLNNVRRSLGYPIKP
jgi:hypothetical protein